MNREKSKISALTSRSKSRHLVFVDIENLAGTGCPSPLDLAWVQIELPKAIPDLDAAQRIVACNHLAAATVAFEFPGALRRWRSGPNGADLALIDEMHDLRIMARFGRVTVCSGDAIFADWVAALGALGIETTVVSVSDRLSRQLRMAAQRVVFLNPTDLPPISALDEAS